MRGILHLAVRSAASIFLMLAVAACVSPLTPEERDSAGKELTIRVYMPYGRPQTKADDNAVYGEFVESMLYNLQIWAFEHCDPGDPAFDDRLSDAYCMINDMMLGTGWRNKEQVPSGRYAHWDSDNILAVKMLIPSSVAYRSDERLKFDFYILANSESIGFDQPVFVTRSMLRNAVFGRRGDDDWFGPTALVSEVVQGTGLPITAFYNSDENGEPNGVDVSYLRWSASEMAQVDTIQFPVIQASRAVSRIRFLFSRQTGMNDVAVDSIKIFDYDDTNPATNGMIPRSSYIFERETGGSIVPAGVTFDPVLIAADEADTPLLAASDIPETDDPKSLCRRANQTAQEYDDFVRRQVRPLVSSIDPTMTQQVYYLRESDKPLKGCIYFTMEGKHYYDTFSMENLPSTSFYRNHTWTVYAYFMEKAIHFKTSYDPWAAGGHIALTGDLPPGIE